MSTRGFLGFVAAGRETIIFNRWESDPPCLGRNVLEFARAVQDWSRVRAAAAALVHAGDEMGPTGTQIAEPTPLTDESRDWGWPDSYRPLCEIQTDPAEILKSGYTEHYPDWPGNSIWCDWGYLLDLDRDVLEVYASDHEDSPHAQGRFCDRPSPSDCYPVRLVGTYPLSELPDGDSFVEALTGARTATH
ncbi:hypothetical protein [Nocardia asteroides]